LFCEVVMTYFLVNENFPAELCALLSKRGTVLRVPPFSALDFPVNRHPDMLAVNVCGVLFVYAEHTELTALLEKHGIPFRTVAAKAGKLYPNDVALNLFAHGSLLFACEKYAAREVLDYAAEQGLEPVNVRQGYVKCSVMLVGDAIVTADAGIYKAALTHGVDALLIRPGSIGIEKYDTGFIGGASAALGAGESCVFGNLELHPDGKKIRDFAGAHGVEIQSLGAGALFDYGGFVRVDT
jgi:hypothetical protein